MIRVSNSGDCNVKKMQECEDYVQALEAEKRKIQVFERELPLCLELVTQAIESYKQQLSMTTTDCINGQSDCSEQISSAGPVLEQFIPVKGASSAEKITGNNQSEQEIGTSSKKSDWLRSVHLGIQSLGATIKECSPRKVPVVEVKRDGCGAFHPFKKDKTSDPGLEVISKFGPPVTVPTEVASSTAETGGTTSGDRGSGLCKNEDKDQKKARRSWSPELHKRFVLAIKQLGGAHVATPKQIRELMKVDSLTNDEVKSHLQKYRLHTRRPNHSNQNDINSQMPQFVVVGGIWMPPPPEYTTAASPPASVDTTTNKI